ncbi:DeoR family transcriptional regulator [Enterobacter cloacae]|uniref:DeoR family transcriptional regulator n=1 Tax=Enterobacter cloacae TaxID=550 RepID=A0A377M792_ENTCL|nr:DeoR family transcriptional regulator [Enterobacter cloacae]
MPVEGEAGSGYRLMSGFDLPPLMLTNKESEALIVAIRLLTTWGGESLSRELESAQEKVLAILPEESRRKAEQTRIYAPDFGMKSHSAVILMSYIRRSRPSACLCCIIVTKRGNFQRVRFSRWGCFSGENAGYWRHGVNCAMTIAVSVSTDASKLSLRKGALVRVQTIAGGFFAQGKAVTSHGGEAARTGFVGRVSVSATRQQSHD